MIHIYISIVTITDVLYTTFLRDHGQVSIIIKVSVLVRCPDFRGLNVCTLNYLHILYQRMEYGIRHLS